MERLDKILAGTGRWSRREVKELVCQGRVRVDGQTARTAEEKVDPEAAAITVDGQPVETERFTYVMLHKPAGVLSATEDSRQQTVLDLLPGELRRRSLSPVGRLDKDTEGLLLLTNQGDLVNQIMRSRYHHEKEYIVRVDRPIDAAFVERMAAGVYLSELKVTTRPCKVEKLSKFTFRIILTQGLNRQIRRMCMECGYHVRDLERVRIMNLTLDGIAEGQYRPITASEFAELQKLLRG